MSKPSSARVFSISRYNDLLSVSSTRNRIKDIVWRIVSEIPPPLAFSHNSAREVTDNESESVSRRFAAFSSHQPLAMTSMDGVL